MSVEKNILTAFLLNLLFSVVEFVGGALTGSAAILSDAVHDLGDALSIGVAWFLERKSKKQPDETFTYGYSRFSAAGGFITSGVLLAGSLVVIYHAARRILHPVSIRYDGMIALAVFGVIVNGAAAFLTRSGKSLNQKAVNLHMLEDVLGWVVVLIGAVVMRFTDCVLIDPLMSVAVSFFILRGALKNMREITDIFLEKRPQGISMPTLREQLLTLDGLEDVHHLHLWSMDGRHHYATLHAVTCGDPAEMKAQIRAKCLEQGVGHVTVEIEQPGEPCAEAQCKVETDAPETHHHHD